MDMKKLIESMDRIEECGMTEMPAMPASLPAPEMDRGNPVTVNVSMNASGKEHVADLLNMMKNAGLGGAEPVGAKMLSPRMDMERLSAIMDEPGFDDKEMPLPGGAEPEMEKIEEGADPKLASMIAKFVDEMSADMRYFGEPDVAKVGMLLKQGNVEDAAGEMADAMTDQDGGSDKFDMVMQRAKEYIEDEYMDEGYEFGSEPRKSEPRKPVSYDPKQSMPSIMKYAYQPDVSNALAKAAGVDSEEVYFDDADLVHGDKTVVPGCLVDDGCTFGDAVKALNKFVKEAMDGEITKDSVKKSALELLVDIAKTSKQYKGEITDDQVHYLGSLVHDFDMAGIETEKYSEIEKLFRTASKTNKADMTMIQPAYAQAKTLDEEAVEAYSPGDENAEGMVSNCCSAPVQDERNGTGRCSACGEGCEAVAEEVETEDMSSEGTYTIKVKGKNMDSQNELARLAGLPTNEVDDASMDDNDIDAQAQEFAQRAIEMAKGIQRDNYYFSDSSYYEFFDGQPDDDDDFMNHDLVQQVMRALPNVDMDKDEIKQAVDALAAMDTSDIVDDEVEEAGGDYENEPDEQYSDLSAVIPDGNDLNRKKKSYAATQDGDNPMAVENIKAALYAALTEKKKTMVKGPDGKMVPDYAADGKGKDDLSKGKKDTKTTEGRGRGKKKTKEEATAEGRGKVMAGRGRGKDKLMAGRGRGKK